MNTKLPNNWVKTTLGEIAVWSSGGTPRRGMSEYYGGDIPWIKTGDLNNGVVNEVSEFLTKKGIENSSAKIFPKDSVGIAMYGATIGKTGVFGMDAATNQACAVAIPFLGMNRYLHLLLKSQKQAFIDKGKGGAQPNISQTVIKAHEIFLPPLSEQQRIVIKLDAMFSRLDDAKERLEKIPELLKNFKRAVLSLAVTGKLTEDWREGLELESNSLVRDILIVRKSNWEKKTLDTLISKGKKPLNEKWKLKYKEPLEIETRIFDDIPSTWNELVWDQISDWITYGFTKPMPHTNDGIPIVTGKNVKGGKVVLDKFHFTSVDAFNSLNDKDKPKKGDLLVTKDGSIGRAAIIENNNEFCINQSVAVAWLRKTPMNRKFLLYVVLSNQVQNEIKLHSKGVAIQHLSVTDFRKMQVPIPSIKEQNKIVEQVESFFSKAELIEKQYKFLKKQIDILPQAILHKAFNGELVEQLPTDGDAKELLKQINKLKEEINKKGKKKK